MFIFSNKSEKKKKKNLLTLTQHQAVIVLDQKPNFQKNYFLQCNIVAAGSDQSNVSRSYIFESSKNIANINNNINTTSNDHSARYELKNNFELKTKRQRLRQRKNKKRLY